MARRFRDKEGRKYQGREDRIVLNTTLSPEVDRMMRAMLPEGMAINTFLTALIYEHQGRLEERQKQQAASAAACAVVP